MQDIPNSKSKTRDADRTQKAILLAAKSMFASKGLGGARLDQVADLAGVDKRLIYYYFKNKERLFQAVLEDAYADIRTAENELRLLDLEPVEAIRKLISFTWNYYLKNPQFVRLINSENLHGAVHLRESTRLKEVNFPLIQTVGSILERGRIGGIFRGGVDPLQLYISLVGLTFYYLSNQHTLSLVFDCDLGARKALESRFNHVNDFVMGYLISN
ncbi:TetR family transcriptional regulator [Pseudomonas fluorescens]|uniref:HTH-type transcriptional repressor NicS n=1 Tax=Pseudomonas fluorescens TaxID=294 RepID=A0A5E7GXW3_PSEFL|nr:TetR family transcriptional regulator [Pseudomonas fluorescens]VVO53443.1 HTH-type transcriptional repressor NicS [Pseudomonas fluorescens]